VSTERHRAPIKKDSGRGGRCRRNRKFQIRARKRGGRGRGPAGARSFYCAYNARRPAAPPRPRCRPRALQPSFTRGRRKDSPHPATARPLALLASPARPRAPRLARFPQLARAFVFLLAASRRPAIGDAVGGGCGEQSLPSMGSRGRRDAAAAVLGLLQVFLFHSASKFMLPLVITSPANKHTSEYI